MIITLASSKGGVGKSTLTGCLAGIWAAAGDTVHIVDLDNNRTVSRWFGETASRPDGMTVSAPDPTHLTEHLEELADTINPDMIFIDIAGTYERALTVAVARAHLTLIPATPSEPDIVEAGRVAKHIKQVFKAFGREPLFRLLLNRVQPLASNSQLHTMAQIIKHQLPRLKTRIFQRAAYEELGLTGQPPHFADRKRPTIAKAVEELDAVQAEILAVLNTAYSTETLQGAA